MADDEVTFTVKLKDLTSGPASRASVNLSKVATAGEAMGSKLGKLGAVMGVAAAAAGSFAAAVASVSYMQNAARDASQLSFALGQLTHGDGRKAMADVGKLAADLGLDAKETSEQFAKMLKLQFSVGDSKTWIKLGADMQALGNSAEDVQGILMTIGQIKSKGRLQGEEMLQLAERGVSQQLVNEEIAKAMGVDAGAVGGLQQAGKVTADIALNAIQSALLRKLQINNPGEAAANYVATSFAGKMAKSEGMFSMLRLGIGGSFEQGVGETGAFDAVFKLLQDPEVIAAVKDITKGLGKLAGAAVELMSAFGGGFSIVFNALSGEADKSGRGIDGLAEAIRAMTPAAQLWGGMIAIVVQTLITLFATLAKGEAFIIKVAFKIAEVGTQMVEGLIEGITSGFAKLKESIFNLGSNVLGWLKSVLGIHSPSREMAYLGQMSAEGYQRGLDSVTPTLGAAVPTISSESAAYSAGRGASGAGGSVAVGGITINVTSSDPQQAGQSVMREFESRFASLMGTYAMGAGA